MQKKINVAVLLMLLSVTMLAACGKSEEDKMDKDTTGDTKMESTMTAPEEEVLTNEVSVKIGE